MSSYCTSKMVKKVRERHSNLPAADCRLRSDYTQNAFRGKILCLVWAPLRVRQRTG